MKKRWLILFFGILSLGSFAQVQQPVSWTFNSHKTGSNKYELIMTAVLADGWHIYSQNSPEGSWPTKISFTPNALLNNKGIPKEQGKLVKKYDTNLGAEVLNYTNKVEFIQPVTKKTAIKTNISGKIYYVVCNDHKCLPPKEQPFNIALL